jgi:hypothetical protein
MKSTQAGTRSNGHLKEGMARSMSFLSSSAQGQNSIDDVTPEQWDAVNQPQHYKKTPDAIECIQAIKSSMELEQFRGYLKGNIQKYVWRYEVHPNGARQSLEKAAVYLQWLVETLDD